MDLGKIIHDKALEYGYDNCSVIRLDALDTYKERLEERIAKFPETISVLETGSWDATPARVSARITGVTTGTKEKISLD